MPGRGQDHDKKQKFIRKSATSCKWNIGSAIQRTHYRKATAIEHMGVDLCGSDIRMTE